MERMAKGVAAVGRAGLGVAILIGWPALASRASCQDARVLFLRAADAKAVPAEMNRDFERAITSAAPGVTLARSLADATHLLELSEYQWDPGGRAGIQQTWRFTFRSLAGGSAAGDSFGLVVVGPLAQGGRRAAETLQGRLAALLAR